MLGTVGGEMVEVVKGARGGWDAWIQASHPKETNPPALPTDKGEIHQTSWPGIPAGR